MNALRRNTGAEMKIYSVYGLKDAYYEMHPNGHFFDENTLKFFGESLSTMRLLKGTVQIADVSGELHECYVLSRLQKKYPGGPRRTYAYFDVNTLDYVILP